MESGSKTAAATPVKDFHGSARSKTRESNKSENVNPNLSRSSPGPGPQQSGSPQVKSASKFEKSAKNPNFSAYSPRNKIRERKFVVAKKKTKKENGGLGFTCKCKEKDGGGNSKKCLCEAYENLRASQEEFFTSRSSVDAAGDGGQNEIEDELEKEFMIHLQIEDGCEEKAKELDIPNNGESEEGSQMGVSSIKRRREKVLEEARNSLPESGFGRVKFLVKAFEESQKVMKTKEEIEPEEEKKKGLKWALPGMQQQHQQPKVCETQVSLSSVCPSDLFLTSEKLGLDGQYSVSCSWDSSRGSISSKSSTGGSRRKSTESSVTGGVRRWKKKQQQPRVTSLKPFRLRTEQRGRMKEEEFMKKLQEMTIEEQKQRIPIAQGLPWTTDEPECLIKPPVKEITRPVDLVLHSDLRAVERAEFDHQVAEKMSLIEQYKMESERRQKMAEEEEIKRLRKELVPKAQPMPYFDRPFIPKRSEKNPTIPREPKFHIPQHKKMKCCLSWNDACSYTSHESSF